MGRPLVAGSSLRRLGTLRSNGGTAPRMTYQKRGHTQGSRVVKRRGVCLFNCLRDDLDVFRTSRYFSVIRREKKRKIQVGQRRISRGGSEGRGIFLTGRPCVLSYMAQRKRVVYKEEHVFITILAYKEKFHRNQAKRENDLPRGRADERQLSSAT